MSIYVEQRGQGPDVVLLHGWGMNSAVWQGFAGQLESHFQVHLIDLPGFGESAPLATSADLTQWAEAILAVTPLQAAWLGWSLGGLIASQAALLQPSRVSQLITLASSPCFVTKPDWPGIKPEVLKQFQQQLSTDHQALIQRFLALQAMGSPTARDDIRTLSTQLANKPAPTAEALLAGLRLLETSDLRCDMAQLTMPTLRLYGRLDGLVPNKVIPLVDKLLPQSQHYIEAKASHAAFISHPQSTAEQITAFLMDKGHPPKCEY